MIQYRTELPVKPAVPQSLRDHAAAAFAGPSPLGFAGPHQDMYAGLASQNATAFDRAATEIDSQAMRSARDTQVQMALRGLQQMAQAQDNQRSLAQQSVTNSAGILNSLLRDLYAP